MSDVSAAGPLLSAPGPDVDAEYWTTSDVAQYCQVQVGTISSYRKRQQMPAPDITVRARTHLWKPERIVRWREEKLRKSVPD